MKKKGIALLLAAILLLGVLAGCGTAEKPQQSAAQTEAPQQSAAQTGAAGTYEGTAAGRNGDIKVAVTLDETGRITAIEVVEQTETEGVGTPAFDKLIPEMVANNTVAVDAMATATITSEGLIEAVKNALTAAGVDLSDYQNKVEAQQGEDLTYDVDVAVVGAGGAGMAAAAGASKAGASVLVLEKTPAIGGNTKLGEGTYNSADASRQQNLAMNDSNRAEVEEALSAQTDDPDYQALLDAVRADYEAWKENDGKTLFDSVNWHALQTYLGGGSIDDISLIRTYAQKAPETLTWLEDTIGVPFKSDYIFMAIGGKWARGHQVDLVAATGSEGDNGGRVYIDKLAAYAAANGAETLTDAKVVTLTTDESGKVNGCVAERTDGSKVTVTAKSVILTTGGYAANSDLVLQYSNGAITTKLTSCATSSTGDGLALAENVGGLLKNLDQIQVHPLGDPIDDCGCVSEFVGNWLSATEYLFVNKEGKRFVNEDNTRYAISMAELAQTDGQMWLIVDSSAIAGDDTRTAQIESLLADGHSYRADTLEELAAAIGVDADALKATVETYNAGMLAGKDEFGKAASADSVIEQGPFYASLRTPTVHYTMGGIAINENAEVQSAAGGVVTNLYAAGEVATGIHGNNRLGGNAYPDIMTFGRIAGEQGAANAGK